jgi:hypothetical protein
MSEHPIVRVSDARISEPSHLNHWWLKLSVEEFCHSPLYVVIVEPNCAVPKTPGFETTVGGSWVVGSLVESIEDQTFVVPTELIFVVRAVMNLPTSANTWV